MDFSFIVSAFIAGLLTFLAPCTLPLVPGYLGFISGVSLGDLRDPVKSRGIRLKIFLNGLFFVFGFSAIFILMGTLVGFLGASLLAPYRAWLSRIGGIFVIIFGLFILDIFKLPFFSRELKFNILSTLEKRRPANSFILGSAFAFGWTPCIGPILGSILLLASTPGTVFQGAFLLTIFSLGLGIPFLVIAAGIGSASSYIERFSRFIGVVSILGGVFLVFLGVMLLTGHMSLLISWGYYLFRFIEYDKLLDYL